jgi:Flp pilus assembly protein TadG
VRSQAGSAAVELTILTPLLVALLLFAVAAGRVGQARADVYGAAAQAARAASLRATPAEAAADARATARRALADRGHTCRRLTVGVTSALRPGGRVSVEVTCRVTLADLTGIRLPGRQDVRARATEVVDAHRGLR